VALDRSISIDCLGLSDRFHALARPFVVFVPQASCASQDHKRPPQHEMDKVYTTIKQFVRDWSTEGKAERDACYGRILDRIDQLFCDYTP